MMPMFFLAFAAVGLTAFACECVIRGHWFMGGVFQSWSLVSLITAVILA